MSSPTIAQDTSGPLGTRRRRRLIDFTQTKRFVRSTGHHAIRVLSRSGLGTAIGRLTRWSGLIVLNYHRIGDAEHSQFDRGLWSASADEFQRHIRLCKRDLDLIAPADLPRALRSQRGRYGLITFDDGYRDNYDVAFPILRAERVPATFFVATGFIDNQTVPWWDEIAWMIRSTNRDELSLSDWLSTPVRLTDPNREDAITLLLRTYKALSDEDTERYLDAIAHAAATPRPKHLYGGSMWMDWAMLREMDGAGMTIGGHTVSHPVLSRASRDRQQEEIVGCANRIQQELGKPMRYFSYPVGGRNAFDATTRQLLGEAGVQFAFSYYGGYRTFKKWDDYDVRRIAIEYDTDCDHLRMALVAPRLFA